MEKEVEKVFGNDVEITKEAVDHKTEEQKEEVSEDKKQDETSKKDVPEHEDVSSDNDNNQSKKTYTQEEVDAMMARARKKYTKDSKDITDEQIEETSENRENVEEKTETNQEEQRDLSTGITVNKLARAELKAQMAVEGVNPSKLIYACKMIDVGDVLENGEYNEEKAKTAIEEMLKVMPELKATQQQEQNQFYFGAPEQEEQNQQQEQKNAIDKAFGN